MNSDTFVEDEFLSVCVLNNLRGMLDKPPTLNEKVSELWSDEYIICVCNIHICKSKHAITMQSIWGFETLAMY